MAALTRNEEILLVTILHMNEDTYGINIRRRIRDIADENWNYGTLYRMLDQLVRKGMLKRREGEPMSEKGGRRKNYHALTRDGVRALQDAYNLQKTLWSVRTRTALENAF